MSGARPRVAGLGETNLGEPDGHWCPLRDLGPVDVAGVKALVANLTEADWTANTFRQDALAASVHSATDNILMKTEWHPSATSTGIRHLEDLVHVWAKERGLDPSNTYRSPERIPTSGRSTQCPTGSATRT